ncbi:hypothetical protein KPH14_008072 [Odynerus spinipes]|uniref:Uncharacterized protein n=1 Tax=Odynerus spinipes TaxID=1348599 RepID=A0AAD9RLF8_9HYME|nr:hypothetical protein KPH14_008072 [Odynerus spinipes]
MVNNTEICTASKKHIDIGPFDVNICYRSVFTARGRERGRVALANGIDTDFLTKSKQIDAALFYKRGGQDHYAAARIGVGLANASVCIARASLAAAFRSLTGRVAK